LLAKIYFYGEKNIISDCVPQVLQAGPLKRPIIQRIMIINNQANTIINIATQNAVHQFTDPSELTNAGWNHNIIRDKTIQATITATTK
jgi:hypothetical protein